MFRSPSSLTVSLLLVGIVGCSSEGSTASPPGGSAGGQSSEGDTGGTRPTDTNGDATGGRAAAGGNANATGGRISTKPASTDAQSDLIGLAWKKEGNNNPEVYVKPVAGADPIELSRIKLTYCGAGAGAMIKTTDIPLSSGGQFALICPSDSSSGDCSYGSYYNLLDLKAVSIDVTGIPSACCYEFTFADISHSLVYGTNAMIKIVYQFDQKGVGINYTYDSVWTVYVDGQRGPSCTLAEWSPSAKSSSITCSS